jgi:NADH-quinone oxidoreductase subunit C
MDLSPILDVLRREAPVATLEPAASTDMPTIDAGRDQIVEILRALRDEPTLQFGLLVDVTAVDRLPAEPRFVVVYHLACLGAAFTTAGATVASEARRLRVRVAVPAADARLPSVVSIFPAANWPERELFDLMGIRFDGHPDLRRILMPDDWVGHPLRKDYPVQIRKDTPAWQPVQVSLEEFAENIRRERQRADAEAGRGPSPA